MFPKAMQSKTGLDVRASAAARDQPRERRMLKKILKRGALALLAAGVVWGFAITRDGTLETPTGTGVVTLDAGEFEAFPLPDYAAQFVDDDFQSYLVEVAPGIMVHVLEVGTGYPVYLQHGLPTSGFLYRRIAETLPRDEFRLIMPTLVGLGFSSKVPASQHSIENHIAWMNTLLEELELTELIFVGHDWGGPIGAGALSRSPDLMQGMVVLNTVLAALDEPREVPAILRLIRIPVVGEIILERVASIYDQLPSFQNDPQSLPPELLDLYRRPVEESGNAKAPLAIARMSVFSPDAPEAALLQTIEDYVVAVDVPVEIVWGASDPRLGSGLADMQALFPQATAVETDAGHFLQEEAPEEIAASIQRIYRQIQLAD